MSFVGDMFNGNSAGGLLNAVTAPMALAGAALNGKNPLGDIGKANQAPGAQMAQLQHPSTIDQANQLYGQTQSGINQQQNFANAAMQASPDVFAQQQQLSNMLMQQAQGGGPNPALAQLNNSTGQNIQQQAALMAGQRGASGNAGMLARQVGQAGAGIQQQAAGQSAVMRAQQQLAAQQQLGGQQAQIAGQQAGAINNLNNATQGAQGQTLNSIGNQNNAEVGSASGVNQYRSEGNKTNAGLFTGLMGGIGHAVGLAHGGAVPGGPCSYIGQQMKAGGRVPGQANVAGDSLKNDKVNAMLSPGEIVIPRHITQGKNAPAKAAAFVKAVLEGHGPSPIRKGSK